MTLVPGAPAFDFSLPSTRGSLTLANLRGRPFLLSFFSLAFTPVWTEQLVQLRERHRDLQGLGVEVAAISVDHLPALRVFDAALAQFPFPLAADWHRGICRAYGVLNEEQQAARRVLMLFDGTATLREVVDPFDPAEPAQLDRLVAAARGLQLQYA